MKGRRSRSTAEAGFPDVAALLRLLRAASREGAGAASALGLVLASGGNPGAIAHTAGVPVAARYAVLALETDQGADRLRSALTPVYGERVLPLLGAGGGTLLLAEAEAADRAVRDLFAFARRVAHGPVAATVVSATVPALPEATDLAHDLLDIVRRLGYAPRLYEFDDLALEYQITRPGPANEYLRSLLNPLLPHDDLLELLRRRVCDNFTRRATARAMHVHANTVDYRLRRIKELTGIDPTEPVGLWYLQSALIAHTYTTDAGPVADGTGRPIRRQPQHT
ncbi:PucR family transcriptional regulator [Nocardia wallacei]|uniref:PucR C-terminal helix-turn-helix domain-containing protein n=1 Tax=Nocardia wallacei TaxID=480035 RepID=A0A7G1KTR8_9NOCA|nr:helix-turn-helix domain-containing protein [Nocardia wallacei]BCK57986.1 hypothetical protein NWFMUON74_57580 [Nocardia wallacei]